MIAKLAIGAVIAAGFGPAAVAQSDDGERKVEKRVVVRTVNKDGRTIVHRDGTNRVETSCEGEKRESDISSGEGKDRRRTRIVICAKGDGASSAKLDQRMIDALEDARDKLAEADLDDAQRAEAMAAIDREIARFKAGG